MLSLKTPKKNIIFEKYLLSKWNWYDTPTLTIQHIWNIQRKDCEPSQDPHASFVKGVNRVRDERRNAYCASCKEIDSYCTQNKEFWISLTCIQKKCIILCKDYWKLLFILSVLFVSYQVLYWFLYKIGNNTERFIPWHRNKKLIKQYIPGIIYIYDQLETFVLSPSFFVLFKFCFLLYAFCSFFCYMKTFEVNKNSCDSNTIVLFTQLTFIEKRIIIMYLYTLFPLLLLSSKRSPNYYTVLWMPEEIYWKNVRNVYSSHLTSACFLLPLQKY